MTPADRCEICREEFRPNERPLRVPGPGGRGWAHPECFEVAAAEDAAREPSVRDRIGEANALAYRGV